MNKGQVLDAYPLKLVSESQIYLPKKAQSARHTVLNLKIRISFTSAVYMYSRNYSVSFRVACQLNVLCVVSERVNTQCFFSPSYVTFFSEKRLKYLQPIYCLVSVCTVLRKHNVLSDHVIDIATTTKCKQTTYYSEGLCIVSARIIIYFFLGRTVFR
jgi:hypothetical protein